VAACNYVLKLVDFLLKTNFITHEKMRSISLDESMIKILLLKASLQFHNDTEQSIWNRASDFTAHSYWNIIFANLPGIFGFQFELIHVFY
jgi:hypothetical protein